MSVDGDDEKKKKKGREGGILGVFILKRPWGKERKRR